MGIVLAALALFAWLLSVRIRAPLPWDYDELYHVGVARELRHGMPESFRWTPFSIAFERFADKEPVFHYLLMPFAGLPLDQASLAGVAMGEALVIGAFAWVLWRRRVPWAPVYLLALAGMGTLFLERLLMCRPQLAEIGFSVLFLGLLVVGASPLWLALVAAIFGLSHASGWMTVGFATLWVLAHHPDPRRAPRRLLLAVPAAGLGWLLGQCLHPAFPHNFRLLWIQNAVVLGQAAAGGEALKSQLASEIQPLYGPLIGEQWPTMLAAAVLVVRMLSRRAWRRREVLMIGGLGLLALLAATFVWMRFFELAVPFILLALALGSAPAGEAAEPSPRRPSTATAVGLVVLLAVGWIYSYGQLRQRPIGEVWPPGGMTKWLATHAAPGDRVFTAIWADSAPLFYDAPQLQSLVVLDPTFFWLADPPRFALYSRLVEGRELRPAAAIRDGFGARWVTLWKVPSVRAFARRLAASGEARVVFDDAYYVVFDLGPVTARPAAGSPLGAVH